MSGYFCVDTPESVHPDQSKNTEMGRRALDFTKWRLTGQFADLEVDAIRQFARADAARIRLRDSLLAQEIVRQIQES
ncbi:MAG: hypothetical protein KAH09_06000 [Desulfobacula sp.]|nr:hypothetical protein [Desulfobacula sp.]